MNEHDLFNEISLKTGMLIIEIKIFYAVYPIEYAHSFVVLCWYKSYHKFANLMHISWDVF